MNIRQKIYVGALSDKNCSVNTGRPNRATNNRPSLTSGYILLESPKNRDIGGDTHE